MSRLLAIVQEGGRPGRPESVGNERQAGKRGPEREKRGLPAATRDGGSARFPPSLALPPRGKQQARQGKGGCRQEGRMAQAFSE